jgi:hypothetical protein
LRYLEVGEEKLKELSEAGKVLQAEE